MTDRFLRSPILLIVFLSGLLLRVGWVVVTPYPPPHGNQPTFAFPDEQVYWQLGQSIHDSRGLVDEFSFRATYMPLYPALVALFVRQDGVFQLRLLQAFIGSLAIFPVYWLGRRLCSPRNALLACAFVAFDPFLVFGFTHLVLTETFFTTLLCLALVVGWPESSPPSGRSWKHSVGAGILFAGCIYLRPSVAGLALLWPLVAAALLRPSRKGFNTAAGTIAVILLLLAPWAMRNRYLLGEWCWLTTRSGISLYDGLGPRATGGSDLAYTKTMPSVAGLSETEWSRYFTQESLRIAREDPARVLSLAWSKFKRTWSLVPNEPGSRTPLKMTVSAGWMIVVLVTALVGIVRRWHGRHIALLLLPVVYFTLMHMVYVGSIRYRVPVMPPIYILSGWAIAASHERRRSGEAA